MLERAEDEPTLTLSSVNRELVRCGLCGGDHSREGIALFNNELNLPLPSLNAHPS